MASAARARHEPQKTVLHRGVQEKLDPPVAFAEARDPTGRDLPRCVKRAFEHDLGGGMLQNGFRRLRRPDYAFSRRPSGPGGWGLSQQHGGLGVLHMVLYGSS